MFVDLSDVVILQDKEEGIGLRDSGISYTGVPQMPLQLQTDHTPPPNMVDIGLLQEIYMKMKIS